MIRNACVSKRMRRRAPCVPGKVRPTCSMFVTSDRPLEISLPPNALVSNHRSLFVCHLGFYMHRTTLSLSVWLLVLMFLLLSWDPILASFRKHKWSDLDLQLRGNNSCTKQSRKTHLFATMLRIFEPWCESSRLFQHVVHLTHVCAVVFAWKQEDQA